MRYLVDAFFYSTGFREDEKLWLSTSGAGLGWGVGAAIGAKLGQPDRQVVCNIGDGIDATRAGEPFLLDVRVARAGGGADSTWHQAFSLAQTRTRNV